MSGYPRPEPTSRALPAWSSVLAVVAHPDDESFGLGAILDAFNQAGTRTAVLCLTHGEASTVHGVAGNLAELRGEEFAAAAQILGVSDLTLRDYPDGGLDQVPRSRLVGEVIDAAAAARLPRRWSPGVRPEWCDRSSRPCRRVRRGAACRGGSEPPCSWLDPARLGCHAAQSGMRNRVRGTPAICHRYRIASDSHAAGGCVRGSCEPGHPHQRVVASPGTAR